MPTAPRVPAKLLLFLFARFWIVWPTRLQDGVLANGDESAMSLTNFDDIDEEDRAGRKTRLFKRYETQGYVDTASLDAASVDKVMKFTVL